MSDADAHDAAADGVPDDEHSPAQAAIPVPPADRPADDDLEPEESEQRTAADDFHIVYNVAGDHIGDIGANRRRRLAGRLTEDEAHEAVRGFVPPAADHEAAGDLLQRRLAVLAGAEDSGRRCAAISLLIGSSVTSGPVTVLPPTRTVEELGRYPFRPGRRYLLPDLPAATGDAAVRRHDTDVLVAALRTNDAQLVVTTSARVGRQQFGDLARTWRPIEPDELVTSLLDSYPGVVDTDGEKRLREVCESLVPSAVRAVLQTLLCAGLDQALGSTAAMGRRSVTRWFADAPDERHVVHVALVALVPFCDRRRYGRHLSRLRRLMAEFRDGRAEQTEPLRQEFAELRAIPLVRLTTRDDDPDAEPSVGPASPQVHVATVAAVFDLYGPELLEPLRALQDELAGVPEAHTQLAVAYGMAMLARSAPYEVGQRLGEWARGFAPHRRTAAYTLALMCAEDTTADAALRIARAWSSGMGERRAATAATAFGLTLAERFPVDAVSHLWALALRTSAVSRYACQSLVALAQDTVDDAAGLRDLLRTLVRQMRHLCDGQPRRPHQERRGTEAILSVLTADGPPGSAGSITTIVLREHADLVAPLGTLWADVLVSRPHRGAAVRALRGDLDHLRLDRSDRIGSTVERLGAEIRSRLAPAQWDWLRRDLPGEGWLW